VIQLRLRHLGDYRGINTWRVCGGAESYEKYDRTGWAKNFTETPTRVMKMTTCCGDAAI